MNLKTQETITAIIVLIILFIGVPFGLIYLVRDVELRGFLVKIALPLAAIPAIFLYIRYWGKYKKWRERREKERDAYYHLKELMEILAEPLENYLTKDIERKEMGEEDKKEELKREDRTEPITIWGIFEKIKNKNTFSKEYDKYQRSVRESYALVRGKERMEYPFVNLFEQLEGGSPEKCAGKWSGKYTCTIPPTWKFVNLYLCHAHKEEIVKRLKEVWNMGDKEGR